MRKSFKKETVCSAIARDGDELDRMNLCLMLDSVVYV